MNPARTCQRLRHREEQARPTAAAEQLTTWWWHTAAAKVVVARAGTRAAGIPGSPCSLLYPSRRTGPALRYLKPSRGMLSSEPPSPASSTLDRLLIFRQDGHWCGLHWRALRNPHARSPMPPPEARRDPALPHTTTSARKSLSRNLIAIPLPPKNNQGPPNNPQR